MLTRPTRRNLTVLCLGAALPLAFLLSYLWVNWPALSVSCEKGADHELLGLSVENAKSFQALTGAYSRFGFRHPGPLMPYLYALSEMFIPGSSTAMGKHLAAQATINGAFLIAAGIWCATFMRPRSLSLLCFPLCWLVMWGPGRPYFHDYWNPSVTMAPMLIALMSAAALSVGRWSWGILLALSSGVLVASHLSSVPMVGALFAAVALLAVRRHFSLSSCSVPRGMLFLSTVIFFLPLIPPLYQAFTDSDFGNVGAILRFQETHRENKSLLEAGQFVGTYFSGGIFGLIPMPPLLVLGLVGAALTAGAKSRNGALSALSLLSLIVLASAIFAATRVTGSYEPYLLRSLHGLAAACQLAILGILAAWGINAMRHSTLALRPAVLTGTLGCIAGISTIMVFPKPFTPRPQNCGRIAEPFIQALGDLRGNFFRLAIADAETWPFAAPLALSLLRSGAEICVDEQWWYLFDSSRTCSWQQARLSAAPHTLYLYRTLPTELPPHTRSFKGPLNTMVW